MSYDNAPRRPATIFNDFRYPMPQTAKPVEGAQWPAQWSWELSVDGSKVFFKIRDGIFGKDDPNAKLKEIELNIFERNALLFYLEEAVSNPNFSSVQYPVRQKRYNQSSGGYDREPSTVAMFTIIRRKAGDIRVHYRRSTYEVTFLMSSDLIRASVRNESGEYIEDIGLSSRAYTRAFITASLGLNEKEINNYRRKEKEKPQSDRRPSSPPPSDPYDDDDDF